MFSPFPALADNLKVLAEDHPPYCYEEEGQAKGFLIDLVRLVMEQVQEGNTTVMFVPWARGYHDLKAGTGDVLFPMAKTPERDKLFKFVGPVFKNVEYFYRKKGSNINISTLDDAKKVDRIGVSRDTLPHQILTQKGFTNLDIGADFESGLHKLVKGRVDLVPLSNGVLQGLVAKSSSLDLSMFEKVGPPLFAASGYIAFGNHVPDTVVAKWQQALDNLKSSGVYQTIVERHIAIYKE